MKRQSFLIFFLFFFFNGLYSQPFEKYCKIQIGGVKQAMLIRGDSLGNPFLLFIHGGPGYPLFPYVSDYRELEKYFTVIYWEQRGTGASYSRKVGKETMNTRQFVDDINEVVEFIKSNYGVSKVYLLAHSWGTGIGLIYASEHPENLFAYIGSGQSVNPLQNERLCCCFVQKEALKSNNRKALRTLHRIDTLHYSLDDALKIRKWIYTYRGIVYSNKEKKPYINSSIFLKVFKSPYYHFGDKMHLVFHSRYSGKTLWDDMAAMNLESSVKEVDVPVYFLLGRHDHLVSSELAAEYFEFLQAPAGKHLIWFENSAHRPMIEEKGKFLGVMKEIRGK